MVSVVDLVSLKKRISRQGDQHLLSASALVLTWTSPLGPQESTVLSALERKVLVGKESHGTVETEASCMKFASSGPWVPDLSPPLPRDPLIIPNLGFSRCHPVK